MKSITKLPLFIFISGLMVVSYSCKKDQESGSTSVHGFVISDDDGRRIADADIWLVKSGGSSALGDKTILYKKSGNDGYYNFDFDAEENSTYYIATEAKHYYKRDNFYFTKGKNNKLDLSITPKGYVKVIVERVTPNDFLNGFYINFIWNAPKYINGDTSFYGYSRGNQSLYFVYGYNPASSDEKKFDTTIFVKALDTVDFTIKY